MLGSIYTIEVVSHSYVYLMNWELGLMQAFEVNTQLQDLKASYPDLHLPIPPLAMRTKFVKVWQGDWTPDWETIEAFYLGS